ncbi:hypothetical protein LS72_009815 [Helicobacter apodemus]|uniref:YopX protein domain-containing protein n=1 Tax=Helicobacter apodemus TaxID=135569 RepID=A0A4U8UDA6_9HELI|nr:YopX family protein [Helicobacter apodemus]MDE6958280.1 YopX family protein [Helicobacter apodemus]TLE13554.1 hypothetical protein LS72_009815 [Helicobacter apodemus]
MKLQDLDFRVWSKLENGYIEYPALAKLGSVLPAKVHRANRAIPFIEFDERDDEKEVEFWTGLRDLNNAKIYEGDIVSFEADSHDMGTLTIVGVVSFENGRFIIEGHENMFPHYSFYNFISRYKDIRIIGNIHINTELLGDEK